jgi:pimeloyl-ACP methyl ester carboxylesterase
VHGLCLNEGHWTRDGINHGEALALKLGYTPLYLRYNTGLPVADNGMALAGMLENLLRDCPQFLTELVIVGHSMGGLVARSASHHGKLAGYDWLRQLRSLVFIGTPHHGAPLERSGNWLNKAMDMSPYAAPFTRFAKMRSAGITDLRHGSIADEKQGFVPLPVDVECYVIAATLAGRQSSIHESLIGDGLVPVNSALGRSKHTERSLLFPEDHQWVGYDMGHIELLGSARVYEQLYSWLN